MPAARPEPAEIDAYRRDGQRTPDWRLPAPLVSRMQDALACLAAAHPELKPDFLPLPHTHWEDPTSLPLAREFVGFATHPDVLDLVEQLHGPDIVLCASAVLCKPAATRLAVPSHQDERHWPVHARATNTARIVLDEVREGNGRERVIPGLRLLGDFSRDASGEDLVLSRVLNDPRLDLAAVRNVELEPGQFSLHDVKFVHRSQPNRSGRRRADSAIRYMPATSHTDRIIDMGKVSASSILDFAARPSWLLHGADCAGFNVCKTGLTAW
jgi:hypothetical protein